MDSDEVYKTIGYIVAVIFFIYLIGKALTLNVRVIEGMTSSKDKKKDSKDSKKGIKDNKLDDEGKDKSNESTQRAITKMEKGNDGVKKDYLKETESAKDILSATYNRTLYLVMQMSTVIGLTGLNYDKIETPNQETLDNINKLKTMKEYLDIVEFAYNQFDELK
jgi:hypothetical protein